LRNDISVSKDHPLSSRLQRDKKTKDLNQKAYAMTRRSDKKRKGNHEITRKNKEIEERRKIKYEKGKRIKATQFTL